MLSTYEAALTNQAAYAEISQFLGHEARLLDENRLDEWLELLDPAIVYEIPIRLAGARGGANEFPQGAYRVRDTFEMISKRIERLATGEAWAETPPSRTVRLVGSIVIQPVDATVYAVDSALMVYRQRAQDEVADLIPARRLDRVRIDAGGCKLVRRTIILAETVIKTPNLGIFF